MKVAIYARVSTTDKDQDPITQLIPTRDWCLREGWSSVEYVDQASALDLRGRVAWRRLLTDAAKARPPFKAIVVWRLDRAFRSMKDMHDTLTVWEERGITFLSVTERFDTMSATGRLMLNIIGSFAEYERMMIQERVNAGVRRAQEQGVKFGRPKALDDPKRARKLPKMLEKVAAGELSALEAAKALGVSVRTMRRIIATTRAEP